MVTANVSCQSVVSKETASKPPLKGAPSKQAKICGQGPAVGLSPAVLDHLDGQSLLQLQRDAGNQAVSSWIAQRAVATARIAHAPAKPANARTVLAQKYPHLLTVLSSAQISQIQQCIDAEFHIQQLRRTGTGFHETSEGTWATTEGVELHRRQMEKEYHWGEVWERNNVVVVPTARVLGDDVLAGRELQPTAPGSKGRADQLDAAYRDMLYTQLIVYPIRLTRQRDKLGEDFELELFWGPIIEPMPHDGGQIRWRNLMEVQQFSMPYVLMLAKRINELNLEILNLRQQARGLPHLIYGQKVGELYGMVYNSSVRVGPELGEIGGYSDDE
ncbi:MAG TPA: hypothetical protein VFE56_09270, partial [Candidatus Binataceae bacterium]|nr:hypothetical protein [Candidatus Binataceae bacterium]